ncbi:extracellular solute-binding protein [Ruminococcus difficilis]|uniref:Extracellular solute-binding protein n=1 Tax=Ruminococcus difficilis TaxID=2763069 RepID=A0A934WSP6_9FIRM|nr:extracellular solute-binding protein [Ruminococcus difficilis]MBK6089233.1 extracellular solute-binding protein [Ruminococcus difficilis]SCX26694.1 arabinogalactan oligomer / maltooligosaccharide transport system substrate-binding protein [Ruminococcaceae bacterium P7]
MKKILAILLAGMITATALAGCGGGNGGSSSTDSKSDASSGSGSTDASAEKVVDANTVDPELFGDEDNISLKVWAPSQALELVKKQVEDFKAAYPTKTFTNIEVSAMAEAESGTQVLNDASAAADVFGFASDHLNKLVDAKVLSEVAFVNTVSEMNAPETVEAGKIKGTLYAYPETNDNGYYLVYDKTVVSEDKAGKLEDILAACKDAGKKFIFDCGNGYYACTYAFTAGVKIDGLEEDGVTQKFVQYDENEAVKTLQAFSRLMHEYKGTFTSLDVAQIASGFSTGTLGAGVDGSWNTNADQKALGDNFGAAKLPTINVDGTDKQLISLFGYKYIGVNAASKFPASAQILAYYLHGEKCQEQRAEELGWGPSNKNVQGKPVITDNPIQQAIKQQSENACVQVNIAPTFWNPMGNLGNKLIADETDPEDAEYFSKLLKDTVANVRDEG